MKCTVGNALFDSRQLTYRDLGHGTVPGKSLSAYALSVEDEVLLKVFSKPFEEFVAMCKEDDGVAGESDIPELKHLGYLSLPEMLGRHRAALAGLIKDYLYFQLLNALLGSNQRSAWRFAINEIAEVSDEGAGYLLRGSGYFI